MAVSNGEIAAILDEVADLLEISGESFFRVRAYRNASRTLRDLSRPAAALEDEEGARLEDIPGVGKDLASKIRTIIATGDLPLRTELESRLPTGLRDVMRIAGLGPRKAHALFLELGVTDLDSLGEAARAGRIKDVRGFGPKTEENILEGIYAVKGMGNRILWADAEEAVRPILEYLREGGGILEMEVAGSYRRLLETVGDLDILVVCEDPAATRDRFTSYPGVSRVIATGPTRSAVVIGRDLQVDIRIVEADSWGAALQYFTGSKAHSVALRGMALRNGMKLNEYGLFRDGKRMAGRTEEEVYGALGLQWIPPELRENRGEIRAAADGALPRLLTLDDVRGDLHVHTAASDGRQALGEVVEAARRKGYRYLAVTDHTRRVSSGLDERALLASWREIEELDSRLTDIHVLKGVEVDILGDGSLDMPDEVLSRADFVLASVHFEMNMSRPAMTRRIVKAVSHPLVDALAHPTCRKLNERPPCQVDMDDVIAAAARHGCILELNASPRRLDIDDLACKSAREHGVKVSVASDAHHIRELEQMRYGIGQARRGWLEKGDVVNSMTFRSLAARLRRPKPC